MKWFLLLFSLYVLTLSAIPCCGDDFCCEDQEAVTGGGTHTDHKDHNKPALPCSPFFCNSCHGVLVPETAPVCFVEAPLQRSIYYDFIAQTLPEFSSAIWQPPQLS